MLSIVVYKHARAHDAENPVAWGAVVWFTGGLAAAVYLISTLLPEPDVPSVRLTELGASSVGLQSRFWIADPSRADVVETRGEYVTAVKERFDAEGIDIPYPHRTLTGGIEFADGPVATET